MKACGFSDTCGLTVRTSELPAPPACEVAGPRSVRIDRIGQPRNDEMSQGGYSKKLETLSERRPRPGCRAGAEIANLRSLGNERRTGADAPPKHFNKQATSAA